MTIPFFPNTGDGTHCFQAALMMALKHFEPARAFTYDELDRISQKLPGKWTWPTQAMLWLMDEGYELKLIEEFDYRAFAARGVDYLIEKCGVDVARVQEEMSDIPREQKIAARFAAKAPLEYRLPTMDDVKRLVDEGWVVICNINASMLHHQEGYSGHFVVVLDVTDKEVVLHDPGLPPLPHYNVARDVFERAWAYPSAADKNLLAIRK